MKSTDASSAAVSTATQLSRGMMTAARIDSYNAAPVWTEIAASIFVLGATLASSQPAPGSLDVHWTEGASDCAAAPQNPLQVHAYEPQTFILRQSPCATFEANFLYLLVGSDKALLIDTGAVADAKQMPLAKTIWNYCRIRTTKSFHF